MWTAVAAAVVVTVSLYISGCGSEDRVTVVASAPPACEEDGDLASSGDSEAPGEIWVYVCGEVKTPGVYRLREDARVCEAVDMAGGFTDQANTAGVNLAGKLEDGQQVTVPAKNQGSSEALSQTGQQACVNINTADQKTLMTLPGIGETRAQAIIAYREENGSFAAKEDIMKVDGIKIGSYEKLKDLISVW